MKKISIYLLLLSSVGLLFSCEEYLDKAPDMGLDEDYIFNSYSTALGYLDICYTEQEQIIDDGNWANGAVFMGAMADGFGMLRDGSCIKVPNSGNWLYTTRNSNFEFGTQGNTSIARSYRSIRYANRTLRHIAAGDIKDMTAEQERLLSGQAHFWRAWFYFALIKRYGGMPKLDFVIQGDGDDIIPRMTYQESHDWMMKDIDKAIELLPSEWDDANGGRPTKIGAMALKVWASLYAASPLMQNGLDATVEQEYNKERLLETIDAGQELMTLLETFVEASGFKYEMTPFDDATYDQGLTTSFEDQMKCYRYIFYHSVPNYRHPEHLLYKYGHFSSNALTIRKLWGCWPQASSGGGTGADAVGFNCPTYNSTLWYDRKGADGIYYPVEPLTPNDNISLAKSGYSYTNDGDEPFKDRDPRFYNNFMIPGDQYGTQGSTQRYLTTWVGGQTYDMIKSSTHTAANEFTGFLFRKYMWPEGCTQWTTGGYAIYQFTQIYYRYVNLLLDMCEAVFEYTGSATQPVAGHTAYTAEELINMVRNRCGVTNVADYIVSDPDFFRAQYRRERAAELNGEHHRWYDIRRWMIAEELFGVNNGNCIQVMTFTPTSATRPAKSDIQTPEEIANMKFTYEVHYSNIEYRYFSKKNYWYPFPTVEVQASNGVVKQNPYW